VRGPFTACSTNTLKCYLWFVYKHWWHSTLITNLSPHGIQLGC